MPRWLLWTPIALISVFLAAVAFRYGWQIAHLTETDVINRYPSEYLRDASPDARAADCVAVPGSDARIWITLRCGAEGAPEFIYHINRLGHLVSVAGAAGPST